MIVLPISALIPTPTQKMGQLGLHQLGEVLSYLFFDRGSYHLKKTVGLLADLIELISSTASVIVISIFMGASPYLVVCGKTLLQEKRPFFEQLQIHTIDITLPHMFPNATMPWP